MHLCTHTLPPYVLAFIMLIVIGIDVTGRTSATEVKGFRKLSALGPYAKDGCNKNYHENRMKFYLLMRSSLCY